MMQTALFGLPALVYWQVHSPKITIFAVPWRILVRLLSAFTA
jgi:hypothetical protein